MKKLEIITGSKDEVIELTVKKHIFSFTNSHGQVITTEHPTEKSMVKAIKAVTAKIKPDKLMIDGVEQDN